jgi:hypothetical protein
VTMAAVKARKAALVRYKIKAVPFHMTSFSPRSEGLPKYNHGCASGRHVSMLDCARQKFGHHMAMC